MLSRVSLQTAERTRELAANTMAELDKQGQQLDTINRDLNEVPSNSATLLAHLGRVLQLCWCCTEQCVPKPMPLRAAEAPVALRRLTPTCTSRAAC